ncbi:hypothetical protein A1Q1_06973 [Trichosporon asahii var. asahii CBS 2479]|uniref:Uncharacterized protein n=1 Tax=Trichosporon asahii var. asahii (strain ATCC 90039 / CBS 2479 / JCM 2466 / KCTC 7840 / NBRC 103889/ NCYC 2677 / UAMH 7654) TaxID=1186058 RepID=J6F8V9_TRIAS|nr:hypothetical protein A1Q1_06973 [Trichosporon asahii var. asahii CBS 2479]EJT51742.1 hypothetical protein A1Q1_06973 [Trichosporon asahii var. asahii CBS 2479]
MGNTHSVPNRGADDDLLSYLSDDDFSDGERSPDQSGPKLYVRPPRWWLAHPYHEYHEYAFVSPSPGHTARASMAPSIRTSNRFAALEEALEEYRDMTSPKEEEQKPNEEEQKTLDGFFRDVLAISAGGRVPQRGSIPSFDPPSQPVETPAGPSAGPSNQNNDNDVAEDATADTSEGSQGSQASQASQAPPSTSSSQLLAGIQTPADFLRSVCQLFHSDGSEFESDSEFDSELLAAFHEWDNEGSDAAPSFSEAMAAVQDLMTGLTSLQTMLQAGNAVQAGESEAQDDNGDDEAEGDDDEEVEEVEELVQKVNKGKGKASAEDDTSNSDAEVDAPAPFETSSPGTPTASSAPVSDTPVHRTMSWEAFQAFSRFTSFANLSDAEEYHYMILFGEADREGRLQELVDMLMGHASSGSQVAETVNGNDGNDAVNEAAPATPGPSSAGTAGSEETVSAPSTLQPRGSPSKLKIKNGSPKPATYLCPAPVSSPTVQSVGVQTAPAPAAIAPQPATQPAPQPATTTRPTQPSLPTPPSSGSSSSSSLSSTLSLTPAEQDELDDLEARLSRYPVALITRHAEAQAAQRIASLEAAVNAANDRALLAELRLQAIKEGHVPAEAWVMREFRRKRGNNGNGPGSGSGSGGGGPPGGGGGGPPGPGGSGPSGGSGGSGGCGPSQPKNDDDLNNNGNGGNGGDAPNGGGGGAGARTRSAQPWYPRSRAPQPLVDANDLPVVAPRRGRPDPIAPPARAPSRPAPPPPGRIRFPPGLSAADIQAARQQAGRPSLGPQLEITRSLAPHLHQVLYSPRELGDGFALPVPEEQRMFVSETPFPDPQPEEQGWRQLEPQAETRLTRQWIPQQVNGQLPLNQPERPYHAEQSSYTPVQGYRQLQAHPLQPRAPYAPYAPPPPVYVPPHLRPAPAPTAPPAPPPTPQNYLQPQPSARQRGWYCPQPEQRDYHVQRTEVPALVLPDSPVFSRGIDFTVPPPHDEFQREFDRGRPPSAQGTKLNAAARPFTPGVGLHSTAEEFVVPTTYPPKTHFAKSAQSAHSEQLDEEEEDEEDYENHGLGLYAGLSPACFRESPEIVAPRPRRGDVPSHVRRWSDALEREATDRNSGELTQFPTYRSNRHFNPEPAEPVGEQAKKRWRRPDSPAPFATFFPEDTREPARERRERREQRPQEEATVRAPRHMPRGPRPPRYQDQQQDQQQEQQQLQQQDLPPRFAALAALADAESRLNLSLAAMGANRTEKAKRPRSPLPETYSVPRSTYLVSREGELATATPGQEEEGEELRNDEEEDTVRPRRRQRRRGPRS